MTTWTCNWHLQCGEQVQSYRTEPLACGMWCHLQENSVKTELNHRTTSWCQRTAWFSGNANPFTNQNWWPEPLYAFFPPLIFVYRILCFSHSENLLYSFQIIHLQRSSWSSTMPLNDKPRKVKRRQEGGEGKVWRKRKFPKRQYKNISHKAMEQRFLVVFIFLIKRDCHKTQTQRVG